MINSYEEVQKQAKELERLARKMRRDKFRRLYKNDGMTLEEIGKRESPPISKERVRQILEEKD